MAYNLDAVKARYGYKEISIAQWRNPRLSVHPARGGPKSPTMSAEAAAQPYIPRYKVKYRVPVPTDDEESEDDKSANEQEDDEKEEVKVDGAETKAEDLTGEAASAEAALPAAEEQAAEPETDSKDPGLAGAAVEEPVAPEPESNAETRESPKAIIVDGRQAQDLPEPENSQSMQESTDDPALAEANPEITDQEAAISEDLPGAFPESPPTEHLVEGVEPEHDKSKDTLDEATGTGEVDSVEVVPPAVPMPPLHENSIIEEVIKSEEDGEKKVVQFAPGTPEPKPTVRPKKPGKSSKSSNKKKKRHVAPIVKENGSDNIIAVVESSDEKAAITIPEEGSEAVPTSEQTLQEDVTPPAPPAADSEETKGHDLVLVEDVEDPVAAGIMEDPAPVEKSNKKGRISSKAISKEAPPALEPTELVNEPGPDSEVLPPKDRSKKKPKKSSKSKKKDSSPPTGLGIDLFPSAPPSIEVGEQSPTESPEAQVSIVEPMEEKGVDSTPSGSTSVEIQEEANESSEVTPEPASASEPEPDPIILDAAEEQTVADVQPAKDLEEDDAVKDGFAEQRETETEKEDVLANDCAVELGDEENAMPDSASIQNKVDETDKTKSALEAVESGDPKPAPEQNDAVAEVTSEGDVKEIPTDIFNDVDVPEDGHDPEHAAESAGEDNRERKDSSVVEETQKDSIEPIGNHNEGSATSAEGDQDYIDENAEEKVAGGEDVIVDAAASPEDSQPKDMPHSKDTEEAVHEDMTVVEAAPDDVAPDTGLENEAQDVVEDARDIDVETSEGTGEEAPPEQDAEEPIAADSAQHVVEDARDIDVETGEDTGEEASAQQVAEEPTAADSARDEAVHDKEAMSKEEEVKKPEESTSPSPAEATPAIEAPQSSEDHQLSEETQEAVDKVPLLPHDAGADDATAPETPDDAPPAVADPASGSEPGLPVEVAVEDVEVVHVPAASQEPPLVVEEEVTEASASEPLIPEPQHERSPAIVPPPSPTLSRRSKDRGHWERPPKKMISSEKKASDKLRSSKHSSRSSKDRHHSDKPGNSEKEAQRQRKKDQRRAQEMARIFEEERRQAEEEELRKIRHEARRVARKAAAAEAARIAKEEAELVAREDAERRRRRREERPKSHRESVSSSAVPKLFDFSSGKRKVENGPVRTSNYRSRHDADVDRPRSRRISSVPTPKDIVSIDEILAEETASPLLEDSAIATSSSQDSSARRKHRHHQHRTEGDSSSHRRTRSDRKDRERGEGERRSRRSAPAPVEKKPRGFFGSLLRGF